VEFGESHAVVLRKLRDAAGRIGLGILGFADMSVSDVAADRKITLLEARLAKFREYEELFRPDSSDPDARVRLMKSLRAAGLTVSPAGGGFSRASTSFDMGPGVRLLRQCYRRADPHVCSIGFGISAEHLPMLAQVDHPYVTAAFGAGSGALRSGVAARRIAAADMCRVVHEIAGADSALATRSLPPM